MPAPIFSTRIESTPPANYGDGSAGTLVVTSPAFQVITGDVVVFVATTGTSSRRIDGITGGTGMTWTQRVEQRTASDAAVQIWTAVAAANELISPQITISTKSTSVPVGYQFLVFYNVESIGVTASHGGSTNASVGITTTANNSTVIHVAGDYNGAAVAARTYSTATAGPATETYFATAAVSGRLTMGVSYHLDAGFAGAKTVGFTAPSTSRDWSAAAIELRGYQRAKMSTFTETFSDGEGFTSRWSRAGLDTNPSSINVVDGKLQIVSSLNNYPTVRGYQDYDLSGSSFEIDVTPSANPGSAMQATVQLMKSTATGENVIYWYFYAGNISYTVYNGTVASPFTTIVTGYQAGITYRLRVRNISGSTLTFDVSTDGGQTWIAGSNTPTIGGWITALFPQAQVYQTVANASVTYALDNINIIPSSSTPVESSTATSWRTLVGVADGETTSWAVSAPVSAAIGTSWVVRRAIVAAGSASYHVKAAVLQTAATWFAARTTLSVERSAGYAVNAALIASAVTSWSVRAQVDAAASDVYNVRQALATSKNTSWNVRSGLIRSTATGFGVLVRLAASKTDTWTVRQRATVTNGDNWTALAAVATVISDVYVVEATTFITAEVQTNWSVVGQVSGSTGDSFDVRAIATATEASEWAVRRLADSSGTTTWGVRVGTSQDISEAYDIRDAVLADASASGWHVRRVINADVSSTWTVRVGIDDSISTGWHVFLPTADSISDSYAVAGRVISESSDQYDVRAVITDTASSTWRTLIDVLVVSSDEYETYIAVEREIESNWSMIETLVTTVDETYSILISIMDNHSTAWQVAPARYTVTVATDLASVSGRATVPTTAAAAADMPTTVATARTSDTALTATLA